MELYFIIGYHYSLCVSLSLSLTSTVSVSIISLFILFFYFLQMALLNVEKHNRHRHASVVRIVIVFWPVQDNKKTKNENKFQQTERNWCVLCMLELDGISSIQISCRFVRARQTQENAQLVLSAGCAMIWDMLRTYFEDRSLVTRERFTALVHTFFD